MTLFKIYVELAVWFKISMVFFAVLAITAALVFLTYIIFKRFP